MLAEMLKEPLQVARLSFVISNLQDLAGRVSEAGAISDHDIEQLVELAGHLEDFRPGKD